MKRESEAAEESQVTNVRRGEEGPIAVPVTPMPAAAPIGQGYFNEYIVSKVDKLHNAPKKQKVFTLLLSCLPRINSECPLGIIAGDTFLMKSIYTFCNQDREIKEPPSYINMPVIAYSKVVRKSLYLHSTYPTADVTVESDVYISTIAINAQTMMARRKMTIPIGTRMLAIARHLGTRGILGVIDSTGHVTSVVIVKKVAEPATGLNKGEIITVPAKLTKNGWSPLKADVLSGYLYRRLEFGTDPDNWVWVLRHLEDSLPGSNVKFRTYFEVRN
jgi:hypothetical protein